MKLSTQTKKKISKATMIVNCALIAMTSGLLYIKSDETAKSKIPSEYAKHGIERSILCMAKNIYHEARGESVEGQKAIIKIVINRAKNKGTSLCSEIYKYKQFSWTLENKKVTSTPRSIEFQIIKYNVENWLSQPFTTKINSQYTHYHEKSISPYWLVDVQIKTKKVVGNHIFYILK